MLWVLLWAHSHLLLFMYLIWWAMFGSHECIVIVYTRVSISWLYPCNKSSYIRFVYCQYHGDWFKCTEQNVNNQNLTQVSQLYVHVSFCLKVNRSWQNLPTGGHGQVICMLDTVIVDDWHFELPNTSTYPEILAIRHTHWSFMQNIFYATIFQLEICQLERSTFS